MAKLQILRITMF